MQITKITNQSNFQPTRNRKQITQDELQGEFDYHRAERLIQKMLKKGLISEGEYYKIMTLNRETFSLMLADLMPDKP
uniref:SHOCT-like domain-containing protein n=1 Tax=uncultured firmicutes bacterium contig_61 TaxID=1643555 RepID=A0A141GNG2_9FIRM|nr:hypothetical protein [uncultured firmicutes bacterium contig_61]